MGGWKEGRLQTREGANHGEEEDSVLEVDKVTSQASPALQSFQDRRRPSHEPGTQEGEQKGRDRWEWVRIPRVMVLRAERSHGQER